IEKVRFGHRLHTNIIMNEQVAVCTLPALLLQPAVENAIKFGLYDVIGDVVITIYARLENDLLKINIENPYDADTSQSATGTGFGLSSIKRRLFLL
ncbi:hypothetical protein ABTM13_19060, partial [Acinetobacter baumannii]